ncbi:hypothetical protein [Halorussus aquaticus]|uniref:Uncharacterized protein n=1 Tax=Halorussus aquaticus TaxID=2953748 RepID=A0ABD5Q816_9EURY|nr:hypothetical protein [Halorussus aquaticus]
MNNAVVAAPNAILPRKPVPEALKTDTRVEPAFPSSDDLRENLYVRDETVTEFEDAVDFEAKPFLREHGVPNETGREIQDATIQVAKSNLEELAKVSLEGRGVDIEDEKTSKSISRPPEIGNTG